MVPAESTGTIHARRTAKPSWQPDAKQETKQPVGAATTQVAPTRSSWLGKAVVAAAILGLLALVVRPFLTSRTFTLEPLPSVKAHVGDTETLEVKIKRDNFTGPVQVKLFHDRDMLSEAAIPEDAVSAPVKLALADDTPLGPRKIRVEAVGSAGGQEQIFDLDVLPLATMPSASPAGIFRPTAGTEIRTLHGPKKSRKYYKSIECLAGGLPVRFVLIPYLGENKEVAPFYMMENKVSVSLFDKFAPGKTAGAGDLPVLGVDYPQAHEFAQWLGGQDGALPLTDQWDTSAGRYEDKSSKGDGPFRGKLDDLKPGDVAINLKEPMPVGSAAKDIAWSECRDMSGNGLEWTRNYRLVMEPAPKKIGGLGTNVPPMGHVVLRGRDFHEPEPILWDEFPTPELIPFHAEERKDAKQLGRIGFRVVIDLGAD
jgi:hypothetical protein